MRIANELIASPWRLGQRSGSRFARSVRARGRIVRPIDRLLISCRRELFYMRIIEWVRELCVGAYDKQGAVWVERLSIAVSSKLNASCSILSCRHGLRSMRVLASDLFCGQRKWFDCVRLCDKSRRNVAQLICKIFPGDKLGASQPYLNTLPRFDGDPNTGLSEWKGLLYLYMIFPHPCSTNRKCSW